MRPTSKRGLRLESTVKGERSIDRNNNGKKEQRTCCLCHSLLVDIPRQIVKLLPDTRQNKNHERLHACVTPRTDLIKPPGSEPVPKNERAWPNRPPNNPCVATPNRWLLNEHTCGSHDWRISQTLELANTLRIVSPVKRR